MEHCCNSTGLIFRCFAIFYGIFLEILPIFDVRFVRQPARPTFRTIISPTFARYTNRLFLSQHRVFFLSCQPAAMFSIAASRSTIPDHKMIFGNFICTSVRSSAFRKGIYQSIVLQPFLPTDLPPALLRKSVAFLLGFVRFILRLLTNPTKKNIAFRIIVQLNLLLCTIYNTAVFATLQKLRVIRHQEPVCQRCGLSVYPAFACDGSNLDMVLLQLTVQYVLSDRSFAWFIQACFSQTSPQFLF